MSDLNLCNSNINKPTADSSSNDVTYHLLTHEDKPVVKELLLTKCYKDEPLNGSLNVCDENFANDDCDVIDDNCSYKAVSSGKIIGYILNIKKTRFEVNDSPDLERFQDNTKKLINFISFIDESYNVFDKNPEIDEYLETIFIFVDSNFRGFGIATKLMEKTFEYIRNEKIPMFKVFCSSLYSSKIMENLNCSKVFEYSYGNYVLNGETVFKNVKKPHDLVTVYFKKFNK